ncbi:MAG: hypothetical protein K2K57_09455, partial [Oscillospiraceae bacterium]|nr:hypothetical protein [Oscillospiraceae bacterium]
MKGGLRVTDGEKKSEKNTIRIVMIWFIVGVCVINAADMIGGNVSLIGSEGLRNAAAVLGVYLLGLAVMLGAAVYGGVKSIVYGVRLAGIYRQGGEVKEVFSAYFGKSLPVLTVIFGIILLGLGGISFAAGAYA